jgi:hypothetical protein
MADEKQQAGTTQRRQTDYRIIDGILPWKDWSERPTGNKDADRKAKLGNQQAIRIGLICDFDAANFLRKLQDGLTSPEAGDDMTFPLEPDNLCFRRHKTGGEDIDQVHALRLIIDERHTHNEKENRSTPVISQQNKQHQGHLHDAFKIKDVLATSRQLETKYSDAGEWSGACLEGGQPSGGTSKRYHMMPNFFNQAGYVTDSETIGQFKQAFTFRKFRGFVSRGIHAYNCSTITVQKNEFVKGRIENDDGDAFGELVLWSDVLFNMGKVEIEFFDAGGVGGGSTGVISKKEEDIFGPLGIDQIPDDCPSGTLCFGGMIWTRRKSNLEPNRAYADPTNADAGKKESDLEDSPEFPEMLREWFLRPYVRVPEPTDESESSGGGTGEVGPSGPTGEDVPGAIPAVGRVGHTATLDFPAGKTTAVQYQSNLTTGFNARDIAFNLYYTSDVTASAAGVIDLFLGWQTFDLNVGNSLDVTRKFLKLSVPVAKLPVADRIASATFRIPQIDATYPISPGRSLMVTIWRSKSDTHPGKFQLVNAVGRMDGFVPDDEGGTVWP